MVISQALLQGYSARPASQEVVVGLGDHGFSPHDQLAHAAWVYVALEDYVCTALAAESAAREVVLGGLQTAYGSFRAKLTASRLNAQPQLPAPDGHSGTGSGS